MEYETYALRNGFGDVVRVLCVIENPDLPGKTWQGCGTTESAAILDAYAKAAEESDEARLELGLLLGMRGDGRGGRPYGS
jgi:hypothetical protein